MVTSNLENSHGPSSTEFIGLFNASIRFPPVPSLPEFKPPPCSSLSTSSHCRRSDFRIPDMIHVDLPTGPLRIRILSTV
jgi:hypothetical protein